MTQDPSDQELVRRVESAMAARALSTRDVEVEIRQLGGEVSHSTIARALRGEGISNSTRSGLKQFVANQEHSVSDVTTSGLQGELRRIAALDIDELQKTWRIAEVAAAYRAEALLEEARAATERAKAAAAAELAAAARASTQQPWGRIDLVPPEQQKLMERQARALLERLGVDSEAMEALGLAG